MTRRILLIEDEPDIADLLLLHLADLNAEVTHVSDGVRGLTLALQQYWDLILLDLCLPRCDGLDICQQVRECNPGIPIIMTTARSSEQERIRGLEAGADDYVTKPFSVAELMARIKAMFRRIENLRVDNHNHSAEIRVKDIVLKPVAHEVEVAGRAIKLTSKEFDLLLHFARAPNHVFKRSELLQKVWGHNHEGYLHTVNTHINRLRAKIEPEPAEPRYITTVWGVGYKMLSS